jgi:hypothetical protein
VAIILQEMGRYDAARELSETPWPGRVPPGAGRGPPDTLTSANGLAEGLRVLGQE